MARPTKYDAGKHIALVEAHAAAAKTDVQIAAIEPYPLTLVERIEQALEDYYLRGDSDLENSGILE